jgi:hypothetical protein
MTPILMRECLQLTIAEQDGLLVRIYELAQRTPRRIAGRFSRDDVIQDVALACLIELRAGRWTIPPEEIDEEVARRMRNRATSSRRSARRALARDVAHLIGIESAPREWMSQQLELDTKHYDQFIERVYDSLPRRIVRLHRLIRDDGLTYDGAARIMGVSPRMAHEQVSFVQGLFRSAMVAAGIATPRLARSEGPRGRRARRHGHRRYRRRGAPFHQGVGTHGPDVGEKIQHRAERPPHWARPGLECSPLEAWKRIVTGQTNIRDAYLPHRHASAL